MTLDLTQLEWIVLAAASVLTGLGGLLYGKRQLQSQLDEAVQQCQQQQLQLEQTQQQLENQTEKLEQQRQTELQLHAQLGEAKQDAKRVAELKQDAHEWQQKWQQTSQQLGELRTQYESQAARFEEAQQSQEEKLKVLQDSEARLKEQFENLANRIFEQKTEKFSESSKERLSALLNPLKEQIDGFKKQVNDQYVKEGQERASLKTEILSLKELNRQITEDAANLTRALKGDNKQQGNWGEVVLEKILSESGLREGHEYETQGHYRDDDGKAFKPDVLVHLPNEKQVIIDSKVSLSAYERYFNSDQDTDRVSALKEHVDSLRTHIKQLGRKDYQNLKGVKTLDYILMFVPVEPAFLLAIDEAPDLIKLALDNNIMLVSPTNLLVALRTINNIWQYEYQNQNAQDIAAKAAKLYDKFVGFTQDLEGVGTSLQTVNKRYEQAMNKLSSGRGNLVRQVESFKQMGIQPSKKLSSQLTSDASVEED
ncbi:Adenylate cyclase, terminal-differentiation specific [Saliniradius amylolyticus]|uniref:Adenylate cyclase, terminal-differentiation specific n=1 Tax=Saliniradius amylolyticus TaxID=2183582 RepID=A0A2S2E3P4_9ALTE|nr:DNA recombination protein RmuC [Saliniradius amylolyticus]AWL12253.1 Adenylate cyclase, terminal-differentiation specific [Saliniradius amylolyticus]